MWSPAQPVALERALGSSARAARQTLRKRGTIFGQAGQHTPWAKETDTERKRLREDRKGLGWLHDVVVDGAGKQMYSTLLH